jgi:hypothetical protein
LIKIKVNETATNIGGLTLAFWFFILALILNLFIYFFSDKLVLASTGADFGLGPGR